MSDPHVTIEINGIEMQAPKGVMLIELADQAGIDIPRFCYHKKLSVAANCRMCLVEVEKAPKPLPACATPVMDGMKVHTRSTLALEAQQSVMEFLLINHPLDCPICDQGGECELQDLAIGYGKGVSRFNERKRVVEDQNLGPLIATDMTRCIHCTRCVRFGEEIGGMPELGATGRSEHLKIGTYIEKTVDSEMSGNVIDLCPVGALTSKPFRFLARAWEMQQHEGIAAHDSVGSNMSMHLRRGEVMRVVPRENEDLNEVWLSDRDRFSYEGLYSEERVAQPLVKRDGEWAEASWEDALQAVVTGLREALGDDPAASLGALISPSATLEEHYLMQKLVRGLGSDNIDHRLRQCDFSGQDQAPLQPGLGMPVSALGELDCVLLIGSNIRKEHPILGHRLRLASARGCRILCVNPVDYDFNFPVTEKLIASPGGTVRDLALILKACNGDGAKPAALAKLKVKDIQEPHQRIADSLRDAERCAVILGPSALNHPQAAWISALAGQLAASSSATLGRLADGANAAGAWLAGCVPHRTAAGEPIATPGLDARQMLERKLKAYLLLGVEPEFDCGNSALARAALDNAGLVVTMSSYRSPAIDAYADVILPIAPFSENLGTLINVAGVAQTFSGYARRIAASRPAWRILRVLGNLLELSGFDYETEREVREELDSLPKAAAPSAAELAKKLPDMSTDVLYRVGDVPIYSVDAVVRRAPSLQETRDADVGYAFMNPTLAEQLGLADGDTTRVTQEQVSVEMPVRLDRRVADGCVRIAAGIGATVGLGDSFGVISVVKA